MLKKLDFSQTLAQVRVLLKDIMTDNCIRFLDGEEPISLEQENEKTCEAIISSGKEIVLKTFFLLVKVDDHQELKVLIDSSESLMELRKILASQIKGGFIFLLDGCDLDKNDEEDYKIKELLNEDHIIVKTLVQPEIQMQLTGAPDQDSKMKEEGEDEEQQEEEKAPQNDQTIEDKIQVSELLDDLTVSDPDSQQQYVLKNLSNDSEKMPRCFERSLFKLITLVSNISSKEKNGNQQLQDYLAQIEEEFTELLKTIQEEEIYISEVNTELEQAQKYSKLQNWNQSKDSLVKILRCPRVRVLDIQELIRLVNESNKAAVEIKDKDIILLLGGSGSGKSTTIHYLAGSTLKVQKVNGLAHIGPVEVENNALLRIRTSPFSVSETRSISSVEIQLQDLRKRGGRRNRGSIIICDTPGFEDNRGPEIDIANGIGLIKAIKGCKSVRPIILISQNSIGDRCDGIKDLVRTIIKMTASPEQAFSSFQYVFTKFNKENRQTLLPILEDIRNQTEANDTEFKDFLDFLDNMIETLTNNEMIFIDPTKYDISGLILDKLMKQSAIFSPDEVFQYFSQSKSKKVLNEQTRLHQSSIQKAAKNNNFDLAKYKLDELDFLYVLTEDKEVDSIKEECIGQLSEKINTHNNNGIKNFVRCFQRKNTLQKQDILLYNDLINNSLKYNNLRQAHLQNKINSTESLIEILNSEIKLLEQKMDKYNIHKDNYRIFLSKLQKLSDYELGKIIYNKKIEYIKAQKDPLINSFRDFVNNNNFESAASILNQIVNIKQVYKKHLQENAFNDTYEECKQYLKTYLNDIYETNYEKIVGSNQQYTELQIKDVKKAISVLESVKNDESYSFKSHVPMEQAYEFLRSFIDKIYDHYVDAHKQIQKIMDNDDSLQGIENHFNQLVLIRSIPQLQEKTNLEFYNMQQLIFGHIKSLQTYIEQSLFSLHADKTQQSISINEKKIIKHLNGLNNSAWIEKYQEGIQSNVSEQVKNDILKFIISLKVQLQKFNLGIDFYKEIKPAYSFLQDINKLRSLGEVIQTVTEEIQKIYEWFVGEIRKNIEQIKTNLNLQICQQNKFKFINNNIIRKNLNYIISCLNISDFKNQCEQLIIDIRELVNAFEQDLFDEFNNTYDHLLQYKDKSDTFSLPKINIAETFRKLILLQQLKEEFPETLHNKQTDNTVGIFDKETLIKKFNSELSDLQYMMSLNHQHGRYLQLNNNLIIVKALSQLDDHMETGNGFLNQYQIFRDKIFKDAPDALQTAKKQVDTFQYQEVQSQLNQLKEQKNNLAYTKNLEQLMNYLNSHIENLVDDTISLANLTILNLTADNVKPLIDNLKQLEKAKQNITNKELKDKIIEGIEDVKKIISQSMLENLSNIESNIRILQLKAADQNLKRLLLLQNQLSKYCSEEVINKQKSLREMMKKVLDQKILLYETLPLENYYRFPPKDILLRLQEAFEINNEYETSKNQIEDNIIKQLNTHLQSMLLLKPEFKFKIEMSKILSVIPLVSESLQICFKNSIVEYESQYKNGLQTIESSLSDALNSQNSKGLYDLLTDFQKDPSNNRVHINKIKDFVIQNYQNQIKQAQELLKQDNLEASLVFIKDIEQYKLFKESFCEIGQLYKDYGKEFKKKFDKEVKALISFFNINVQEEENLNYILENLNESFEPRLQQKQQQQYRRLSSKNMLNQLQFSFENNVTESFDLFIVFVQLSKKQSFQLIINKFIQNFDLQITEVAHKIFNSFNNNGLQFNEALANKNIEQIVFTLKLMKQWDSLYMMIFSLREDLKTIAELKELVKLPTSYQQMKRDVSDQIKLIKDGIINCELINEDTNKGKKNRDEYYYNVKQQLNYIKIVNKLKYHKINDVNVDTIENDCFDNLYKKIESLSESAKCIILKENLSFKDYQEFNLQINNLNSISQIIDLKIFNTSKLLKNIESLLFEKVQRIALKALHVVDTDIDELSKFLIQIKTYSKNIPTYQTIIDNFIEELLQKFKVQQRASGISKLGIILEKSEVGMLIVAEHSAFQGYNISIFNSKTQKYTIENVLSGLKGDQIQQQKLLQNYKDFEQTYQGQVKKHLSPNFKIDDAISDLNIILSQFSKKQGLVSFIFNKLIGDSNTALHMEWNNNNAHYTIQLIAHLFAIWTLQNSQFFFEAKGLENQQQYLFTPHPGQVISIFRILGIGFAKLYFQKNLVEIKTGEGKSVTLAISAIVLALLGFDVYCACYSEYLSIRDHKSFSDFFRLLNVSNNIKYGTFNSLSESIINAQGDIRNIVSSLITNDNITQPPVQGLKKHKVLLVDEVDVVFSKEFYGEQYCAKAILQDQTINDLIDSIWQSRNQNLTFQQIISSPQYQACFTNPRFQGWEFLIEEAVKFMICDLQDFESDEYYVMEDKIGYKQQDNIIFNISKSYKTLFAYYLEHERGKVSINNMAKYKRIGIKCGQFSYAEILNKFDFILGVTGTLEMLSQMEKDIIQNHYKIKTFTYIPSVFGQNKLRFNEKEDILIRNKNDYYNSILQEIKDRLVGNNINTQRAVLVFFENRKNLLDFSNQMNMSSMIDYLQILTENETNEEKLNIIKHASAQGYVTLLTKEFGRGTDFISRDDIVNANGGVHVIQVFLSEERSEEVQIKGRTARQGENGSYSMVLHDQYLEKYGITAEDLVANKSDIYKLLDAQRNKFFESQYQNNIDLVKQIRPEHNNSMQFLENIANNNINEVKKYLRQQNQGPEVVINCMRTLVLMDATGSMSSLLQKAKNTVSETFKRAYEICKKFKIKQNSFKVQMAVYRNYSSRNNILQYSSWETQPELLFQFLKGVNSSGGQGREAIEIGFQHANYENANEKISQIILIGDAPANLQNDVQSKRSDCNFSHPKYPTPTFYKDELLKLKNSGIIVHAFYVAQWAKDNFQEISTATGGRCESLDIDSNLGAEMLTNLITEEILRKIGEQSGKAEDFVKEYRNAYKKAYI